MPEDTKAHLHDADTGTTQGVPAGTAEEESKGLPDTGRQDSETAPFHPKAETGDT